MERKTILFSLPSRRGRACHPERRRRVGSALESPAMTRLGLTAVTCLLFAVSHASAQQPPSGRSFHDRYAELVANPRHLGDSARLSELFRANSQYVMTEFPEFATYVGYPGQNARWTDNSLQAIERRKRELQEPLAVVKAVRRDRVS